MERDYLKDKDFANRTRFIKEYKNVEQDFNQYEILNFFPESDKEKILNTLQKK